MFGRRKPPADLVEPDLPITPMLDMSFQLMAFFIFTFRPAPPEGQLALTLPKDEGGQQGVPGPTDDKPVTFVARVEATDRGAIASISLLEKDAADPTPQPLGADVKDYQKALKARADELKGKPAKLVIELGDGILHDYVVKLVDAAVSAGFTDFAAVPLDPKRR